MFGITSGKKWLEVSQAGSDWPIDHSRLATDFNGIDCMSPPIGHIELQNI